MKWEDYQGHRTPFVTFLSFKAKCTFIKFRLAVVLPGCGQMFYVKTC